MSGVKFLLHEHLHNAHSTEYNQTSLSDDSEYCFGSDGSWIMKRFTVNLGCLKNFTFLWRPVGHSERAFQRQKNRPSLY